MGIPAPLVPVLKEHRRKQEQERAEAANLWNEGGWVFRRGGPVHPKVDHDAWKDLLRKAGVRDARLHDARHTAATMLLLLGVPGRAVMDVIGWSQASMTSRYQHMTPELTTSIADRVGELFCAPDDQDTGDDDDDNGTAGALAAV